MTTEPRDPRKLPPEVEKHLENIEKAATAALEHHKKTKLGKGELPCPVCKTGTLRYAVRGSRHHMMAACTTKGCVSWME